MVEQRGELFLDVRYSLSSMMDDSALIRLQEEEIDAYLTGGHAFAAELAGRIAGDPPSRPESGYHERDLFRSPDRDHYRAAVSAAIANHTWLAQQRRGGERAE